MNERIQKIIEETSKASLQIPFGNSQYQNRNFVVAGEITPARQYRHCLLRIRDRVESLRECYYSMQLEEIDIEKMEWKSKLDTTDTFEKRKLAIKIEQKKMRKAGTEKLIQDCLFEIETLYQEFERLPKYTRQQFEEEEQEHYKLKLARDAYIAINYPSAAGQLQSLDDMKIDYKWLNDAIGNPEELLKLVLESREIKKELT